MASSSPPKPWERAGSGGTLSSTLPTTTTSSSITSQTLNNSGAPSIPERPSSLSNVVNRTASNYTNTSPGASTFNRGYGSSPYGGAGGGMYSRFGAGGYGGAYGSSMYGGSSMFGGGGYGGLGGGMYGAGPMYGGGPGMYGGGMPGQDLNDSLTNNFQQSTQATFQVIESIVGAFGGFAQMLESTYMATHSSFFAMVSVAEQFGNLRQTLGSVLGIYALLRWMRTLLAKLTGRPPPADATALTPANFFAFSGTSPPPGAVGADGKPIPPRLSKKPFIVFALAVFGLPYLMGKMIKALAKSQETAQQQQQQQARAALDPSKLDFCRVLYDFPPAEAVAAGNFNQGLDLEVKKGDLVAVLDKTDPEGQQGPGQEGSWWRCRARDGRMGYLPAVYLETIQRRPVAAQISDQAHHSAPGSRANTMPVNVASLEGKGSTSLPTTRAQTLNSTATSDRAGTLKMEALKNSAALVGAKKALELDAKTGRVENFQKAWGTGQ